MNARSVLKAALESGVDVTLNGDNLRVKARTTPPPGLIAILKQYKPGIIAILRQEAAPEAAHEPHNDAQVQLEERKGMAMDSVPEQYLDAWAMLQCQRPARIGERRWRQAIDDAGHFLDEWGQLAGTFDWLPNELFAVPRDGRTGGLCWWLNGRPVTALGPDHAAAGDAVYDRLTTANDEQAKTDAEQERAAAREKEIEAIVTRANEADLGLHLCARTGRLMRAVISPRTGHRNTNDSLWMDITANQFDIVQYLRRKRVVW